MDYETVQLQLNQPLPDAIQKDFHGQFFVAWFHDTFYIMVKDFQGEEDTKAWKNSKFELSISHSHSLFFFIFHVIDLDFFFDVPYDISRLPISEDEVRKGMKRIFVMLVDDDYILRGIRGIELSVDTREKIGEMFAQQRHDVKTVQEYNTRVAMAYAQYPDSESLLRARVMEVKWEKGCEVLA